MGVNIFIVLFFLFLSSCEKEVVKPSEEYESITNVEFKDQIEGRNGTFKQPMLIPENFNQEKVLYVSMSYYNPVVNNTHSTYKIFIFPVWDQDFGFVQTTSVIFYNCDTVKLDGTNLVIYPNENSVIYHMTPEEGQNQNFPYTDSSIVIFEYEDQIINFIPNYRYENSLNISTETTVKGIYFMVTDYLND